MIEFRRLGGRFDWKFRKRETTGRGGGRRDDLQGGNFLHRPRDDDAACMALCLGLGLGLGLGSSEIIEAFRNATRFLSDLKCIVHGMLYQSNMSKKSKDRLCDPAL